MKRLCMTLIMCLTLLGMARAEIKISDIIDNIPVQKQSLAYSISDSVFRYNNIFVSKDFTIKWLTLNVGLGIIPNEDELTFNVGTTLIKFDDVKILENIPVIKWFEISPYLYGGFKRINGINANQKENSEFDFGTGIILISLKFG